MKTVPKLHIVTGKGGVGKTSVAAALALGYARDNHRVLLAEVNGGDRVAEAFGTEPTGYEVRELAPKLWAMDLTPEASLREYVLLTIKVQAIYRAIFEGRVVASFLRLLPALGELTMLGKVWYEWEQRDAQGRCRYDVIVLDAPATGHARALLLAAQAVKASVPKGPMRDNAERIDTMLHAPTTQLDVVTTAEDMPVSEAHELLQFAAAHGFANTTVVANQVTGPLSPGGVAFCNKLAHGEGPSPLAGCAEALLRRDARARRGREALGRLAATTGIRAELVAYPHGTASLQMLGAMSQALAAVRQDFGPGGVK